MPDRREIHPVCSERLITDFLSLREKVLEVFQSDVSKQKADYRCVNTKKRLSRMKRNNILLQVLFRLLLNCSCRRGKLKAIVFVVWLTARVNRWRASARLIDSI